MAAMLAALALLVGVVAYDPTPLRIVAVALCATLAGFTLGRRSGRSGAEPGREGPGRAERDEMGERPAEQPASSPPA